LTAQSASTTKTAVAASTAIAAISTRAAGRCGNRPIASSTACAADTTGTARAALPPKTAIASEAACTTCNRSAVGEGVVKIGDPTSKARAARAARTSRFAIAAGTTGYAITTSAASRAIVSGSSIDAICARCARSARRTHSAISSRSASRSNDSIATGEVAGVRIRRAAAIGGGGHGCSEKRDQNERGDERNGNAGVIFHGRHRVFSFQQRQGERSAQWIGNG
jgi:hypothetical protein